MFVDRRKILIGSLGTGSTIDISLGTNFFPVDNAELIEDKFVKDEIEKSINPIVDYKKVIFKPCDNNWNIIDKFKINLNTKNFVSENKSISYFNPQLSIGIGTEDGKETLVTQYYGSFARQVSIPTRSIYLPDHPFETNDLISLSVSPIVGSASINVANSSSSTQFAIPPEVNEEQQLYVIKKSKDFIGIVTQVGLT